MATTDETMFAFINDIKGDSTEKNHKDWIPVGNLTFDVERGTEEAGGSSQRGFGKATFKPLTLTSNMGTQSMKLMMSVANGTLRDEIIFHFCKAGKDASTGLQPYLIWKIKEVYIQSYNISGGADAIPEETWKLNYNKIAVEFWATDLATGALKKKEEFKWDLAKGMLG